MMSPSSTRSAIVRLGLSIAVAAAATSAGQAAFGARPASVIPAAGAASAPAFERVSPYTLANRRHAAAAAAAASAPSGPSTVPASIRHNRQGLGRAPAPHVGVAGT